MSSAFPDEKLPELSHALYLVARQVAQDVGSDPILTAMAMGHAATRMLREATRDDDAASFLVVDAFAQSSLQSMADMIAGQDAAHQVRQ